MNKRDSDGALEMGVARLEHHRNEMPLKQANVEPIIMVMRRLEWFSHVK